MARKQFFLIISFLLLAGMLFAQRDGEITAWLDTQSVDNKQIIRGWCQNNGTTTMLLSYHAEYVAGAEKFIRKGTVLAEPLQPKLLTNAVFVVEPGSMDSVKLLLFQKKSQVFSTVLVGKQPQAIQELPPSERTDSPTPLAATPAAQTDVEIDGLVLDETRSKLAHDFYELFYSGWTSSGVPAFGRTIIIREMPARIGIGTQVVVEVDDRQLTTLNLQPRAEVIENLAAQLVEALAAHLLDPNNLQQIESDDLNGSGIY